MFKTEMFEIQKGVALPTSGKQFDSMAIGDSFVFPKDPNDPRLIYRIRGRAEYYSKRSGSKFSFRIEGEKYRCWRIS